MVSIENKKDCCGCTACEQVCPRKCISLTVDNEGFSYPEVDKDHCMNCGLCDSVCPIKANKEPRMPLHVYAAKSCDMNIQKASSSGGVFYHIASYVLGKGGVVFGARFDENWRVIHDYTDSLEGLRLFMTSKYVQSEIGVSYKVAKDFLRIGRIVFFTGTPCQIAGLHSYLRHSYDNLLTMDVLCHGVPSPKVWNRYLIETVKKASSVQWAVAGESIVSSCSLNLLSLIEDIQFREKSSGWKKYRFVLRFSKPSGPEKRSFVLSSIHKENPFMKGFLADLFLRPSCHQCRFKRFQSLSDITVADFWSIGKVLPEFYDPMGVSILFVNTNKAEEIVDNLKLDLRGVSYFDTLTNGGLKEKVPIHKNRALFFSCLDSTADIEQLIERCVALSFHERIIRKIKRVIKRYVK